jgi:hypothetical protein
MAMALAMAMAMAMALALALANPLDNAPAIPDIRRVR